eukprot:SAG31_NODE_31_length_32474_cov_18.308139_11_plen_178_part_00
MAWIEIDFQNGCTVSQPAGHRSHSSEIAVVINLRTTAVDFRLVLARSSRQHIHGRRQCPEINITRKGTVIRVTAADRCALHDHSSSARCRPHLTSKRAVSQRVSGRWNCCQSFDVGLPNCRWHHRDLVPQLSIPSQLAAVSNSGLSSRQLTVYERMRWWYFNVLHAMMDKHCRDMCA